MMLMHSMALESDKQASIMVPSITPVVENGSQEDHQSKTGLKYFF